MKQFRKLFALALALCMMFTVMPVAFAEGETVTYELQGETVIFAPPAGQLSEITYTVIKTTTTTETNEETGEDVVVPVKTPLTTTLSISGEPAGVKLNDARTAILVSGDAVESGSFTVTATSSETEPITKTVTIHEYRIYEDFDSQAAGQQAKVFAEKISNPEEKINVQNGSSITISAKAENSNDMYVHATQFAGSSYLGLKPENTLGDAWRATRYITFEFSANGYYQYSYVPIFKETSNGNFEFGAKNYYICYKNTGADNNGLIWTKYPNGFTKMQLIADYYERQYTLYINGTKYGPYAMTTDAGNYAVQLWFGRPVDDIAIYSGKPAKKTTGTINGEATLLAPPVGVKSALVYSIAGSGSNENVNWSIDGSFAGVSVDNNGKLILDGSDITSNGTFTLVAESAFEKATKTITISPVRIFEDFTGQEEGAVFQITLPNFDGSTDGSEMEQQSVKIAKEGDNLYFSTDATVKTGAIVLDWGGTNLVNAVKAAKTWTLSYKARRDCAVSSGSSRRLSIKSESDGKFYQLGNETLGKRAESGWNDIRIVFDFTNDSAPTYKLYVNDTLAAKDVPLVYYTDTYDSWGYRPRNLNFYGDMDDFAIYSGETVVEDYATVNGIAYVTGSNALASGNNTVRARLGNLGTGNKMFFMAHYDANDNLVKLDSLVSPYEEVAARLDNVSGGKVRLFLWNGEMAPYEITSIVNTID